MEVKKYTHTELIAIDFQDAVVGLFKERNEGVILEMSFEVAGELATKLLAVVNPQGQKD